MVNNIKIALNNLDQSKAFNLLDHRFLMAILETVGFKQVFCAWISIQDI